MKTGLEDYLMEVQVFTLLRGLLGVPDLATVV
jgi:hypothetical protein